MTKETSTEKNIGEEINSKEEINRILKDLRENLIEDLNYYDPSVGLYPVNNLMEWSKDAFDDTSDASIVSESKTNLIFKLEGFVFEIYEKVIQVGEEEYDCSWCIREYDSLEDTVS